MSRALRFALPPLIALAIVGGYFAWRWSQARDQIVGDPIEEELALDAGEVRFLKGQTHAHSNNSGDSQTPPEDVGRWYAEHGYDFVVFTDHNFITQRAPHKGTLLLPGVELTQAPDRCEAPAGRACPLHVNALFVDASKATELPAAVSNTRLDLFTRALEATAAMKGLAQLNHPNFHYVADAKLLGELARRGATLLEIANMASDSNNEGDATHPNTEALWDAVLSEGLTMYGVASDDAHHYYDAATAQPAFTGDLGFVMVRARKDRTSIHEAMARGDFYASTGLMLTRLEHKAEALELETATDVFFRCIADQGRIIATARGRGIRCEAPPTGYVRAVAEDAAGRKAWTQPIRRGQIAP